MVGRFFRQGLRVSGEDLTHIRRELNGECAVVEAVAEKLKTLGGTSRIVEVIKLMAENASQSDSPNQSGLAYAAPPGLERTLRALPI